MMYSGEVEKIRRWSVSSVVDLVVQMVDGKAKDRTGAKRCIQNVKYKVFIVQELPRTV